MKRTTIAAALLLAAGQAWAEEVPSNWQFALGAGITSGGEEFGKVHVFDQTTGEITHNENIRAGRLFQFDIGTRYRFPNAPLSLQATIGYHFDSVDGERNDQPVSIGFTRYPLELLPAMHWNKHSLGLGLRYDFQVEFEASDGLSNHRRFENQAGGIAEYSYAATENISFGLRYVRIEYKLKDDPSQTIDGSHVGINARFYY